MHQIYLNINKFNTNSITDNNFIFISSLIQMKFTRENKNHL